MNVIYGFKNLSKILSINQRTFDSYIYDGKIKKIPKNIIISILNLVEREILGYSFSLLEVENKTLMYKYEKSKSIYPEFENNRKLPIRIDPNFESILYHLLGDGYVGLDGGSEYTQLNEINKSNFLKKLFFTFGFFNYSKLGYKDGRVYIPMTIINIISKYYGLGNDDFRWDKSYLPSICIYNDASFKLAGLMVFVVDEAHVYKVITVHSSNKYLLSQIKQITLDLEVLCSPIRLKKGKGSTKNSYRFNILKGGVKTLYLKGKKLEQRYKTCNFAQKEERISKIVNQ